LPHGPATKAFLRFDHAWWRRGDAPRAYGTNLPCGAVWDGAEDQPGAAVLTFLGGGRTSQSLQKLMGSPAGRARATAWLGASPPGHLLAAPVSWEDDPFARGAYGVFTPAFDPRWRAGLEQSHGRVFFAGEHTSEHWQGYMNGAVESGDAAAAKIAEAERVRRLTGR
jgi:monoamine oxidase